MYKAATMCLDKIMIGENEVAIPPITSPEWKENAMHLWPKIDYPNVYEYLVHSKAFDNKSMKSFRSTYAHNYVYNGWLGKIYSRKENGLHMLWAAVTPSQPGGQHKEYNAVVIVEEDGSITTAICTCPAGKGRGCSHVAAIMYAVYLAWEHGVAGSSCTDMPVTWGTGNLKTVSFTTINSINFKKSKLTDVPIKPKDDKIIHKYLPLQYDCHADLKNMATRSHLKDLFNIPNTILNYTVTKPMNEPFICPTNELDEDKHTSHDGDFSKPVYVTCPPCKRFYNRYVALSKEKIVTLTTETCKQDNNLWFTSRKLRLTASTANSIPKTEKGNPNKFIKRHLHPSFRGNTATMYGQQSESMARAQFVEKFGINVYSSGTIVCFEDPWLSCSPDGIIDATAILEIKCPVKKICELIEGGKYDLRCDGNDFYLHKKGQNGYYHQVQILMHVTGARNCKFFVWTPEDSYLADVKFDNDFVDNLLKRLRKFYFMNMLPVIVDEFRYGALYLAKEYQQLCDE